MAKQLQLRRGTTAANNIFTGAQGELTMDTDTKGLRIHDGSTVGGFDVVSLVYIMRPTEDNNYTWARKWSDGWVEQGVNSITFSSTSKTWTFPIPMADDKYAAWVQKKSNNANLIYLNDLTATNIKFAAVSGSDQINGICIAGYAAEVANETV